MEKNQQNIFSIEENKPVDWFEPLYANANKTGAGVPWANMATHPSFKLWLNQNPLTGNNKLALVVGCGMGDDAIELERLGFQVTAFDVSETAIKLCKERFPESTVKFVQADLFQEQTQWHNKFDFVLEIYTVQALPPKYEAELIRSISGFVSTSGQLLVIAEVSDIERTFKNGPPWLLTPQHVDAFIASGLSLKDTHIEPDPSGVKKGKTYSTTFNGLSA